MPIRPDGSPGPLRQVWQAEGSDFPEGIAIGRSGDLYVSAAGNNQIVVLSAQGRELARVPMSSQENNAQPVPFDEPATVAFDGTHILTPNHAYTSYNPAHWAVLSVDAGEPGIGDFHPVISSFAPSPGGGSPPSSPGAGRSGCGRGRVVVRLPRARRRRYTRARAFVDGRLARTTRGRRLRAIAVRVPSGPARGVRVKVVARTRAGRAVTVRRLYPACAGSGRGMRVTARERRTAP